MNFIDKIKNYFQKNKLKQLPEASAKDEYSSKVESIDDIELIQNFKKRISNDLKIKISEYQRKKSI